MREIMPGTFLSKKAKIIVSQTNLKMSHIFQYMGHIGMISQISQFAS